MLSVFAGGKLFGERTGDGAPNLLALHGWRCDHARMQPVVSGFDAISLDLPGFGKSPAPDAVWGAADYADAVAQTLDEFERPPVVVGHSFGGRVAVNLAARYPDRVQALVLVGVPLIRRQRARSKKLSFAYRLVKWANRIGVVSDKWLETERRKRGSADYLAAVGIMREIFVELVNESYEEQLKQIKCRVELVWGEQDTEAPLHNATEAQQYLQQSKLTVVPDADHHTIIQHPVAVQEAIRRCLT